MGANKRRSKAGLLLTPKARQVIDEVRAEKNLTQQELGERMGCRQGAVSDYCSGHRSIDVDIARKFYHALDQDPRVEFLMQSSEGKFSSELHNYVVSSEWGASVLPESAISKNAQYVLCPFYERIDAVYRAAATRERCRIISDLENLILRYEQPAL